MFRRLALATVGVLVIIFASGCGSGGSSPTAPSSPYPTVGGNYAGTITITFPSLGGSLSCPATTTVTQSGANVTFAPLTMTGACTTLLPSLPLGDFTISTTGSLGGQTLNNIAVASCSGTYNAVASGGFFGTSFQFSFLYTAASGGCVQNPGNFTFAGTLSR